MCENTHSSLISIISPHINYMGEEGGRWVKKKGEIMKLKLLIVLFLGILVLPLIPEFSFAEYADIILNSKAESMRKAGVNDVMFPHWFHRIRFKCKVCHEDIFILKAGANDINMTLIMNGEKCGKCHNGIIAWEPLYCDRCHSWEPGWAPGPVQLSKKVK